MLPKTSLGSSREVAQGCGVNFINWLYLIPLITSQNFCVTCATTNRAWERRHTLHPPCRHINSLLAHFLAATDHCRSLSSCRHDCRPMGTMAKWPSHSLSHPAWVRWSIIRSTSWEQCNNCNLPLRSLSQPFPFPWSSVYFHKDVREGLHVCVPGVSLFTSDFMVVFLDYKVQIRHSAYSLLWTHIRTPYQSIFTDWVSKC